MSTRTLRFGPATTSAASPTGSLIVHDTLEFQGYLQPPDVPPDPTGEDWRGPPGPPGPPGPAGTVPTISTSDTPPTLSDGALWWDSASTQLYIAYDDGTSLQWVIANNYGGGGGVYLPMTGGTLTGPLTLSGNATLALHAVPLQQLNSVVGAYLPLTGGTLTGNLDIGGNLTVGGTAPFLRLTGGTVTGATTFSAAGTALTVTNNATVGGNMTVNGEAIPVRLNLGSANGNGLAQAISTSLDHTTSPFWLNYYFTGNNAATANQNFNSLIVNDNVNYIGNGQSNALFILQKAQANATRAGGLWVESLQTAAPVNPFGFCTGLTAAASLAYNCGGTSFASTTSSKGAATTLNTYTTASSGATFINGIVGYEMDIAAVAGSSLAAKTGLLIARLATDAVSGAWSVDSAIAISAAGSTAGWDYMLSFGGPSAQIPWKSTATFIKSWEPQTPTTGQSLAAWGIDFFATTFAGGFAKSLGFQVDGSGRVTGQRLDLQGFRLDSGSGTLSVDQVGRVSSLSGIAAGGAGYVAGDKVTTAPGGVYVITAVSGGVATAVTQLVPGVTASPPANPVATTATNNVNSGFFRAAGTGLTLNLTWSAASGGLSLMASGGATTVGGNFTASGTVVTLGSGAVPLDIIIANTNNVRFSLGTTTSVFTLRQGSNPCFQVNNASAGTPVNYVLVQSNQTGSAPVMKAAGTDTNIDLLLAGQGTGGVRLFSNVGFNNTAPIAKPTISGSRAANAALASLLTALASYGLVTDSTTA